MSKVVITGGAGFIGSHIADTLTEKGFDVHIVDDLSSGKREQVPMKVTLHVLDIRDHSQLCEIFKGADTVFHLAAIPQVPYSIEHPLETHDVNLKGTVSVFTAARDTGVRRVVYSASSAAYGEREDVPFHEGMEANPMSPYGLQKYVGELEGKLYSALYPLEVVSLRYFNVFGPRQDPRGPYAGVIGRFLLLKAEGKPLTVVGDGMQTRDFVHVRDVARANILAMESEKVGKGEVINIGTGKETTVNEVARILGGEVQYVPARIEPKRSCADTTKAKEFLGWRQEVEFEDGLKELVAMIGSVVV